MSDEAPEAPQQPGAVPTADPGTHFAPENTPVEGASAPSSGRRPSIRDLRRQLTDEELKQTGVQKLLLEDLERAELECETLRVYVERFHEADKEAAILKEQLKMETAFETMTSVGLIGGGAILGIAPNIWSLNTVHGIAALVVGGLFSIGSLLAKRLRRSK